LTSKILKFKYKIKVQVLEEQPQIFKKEIFYQFMIYFMVCYYLLEMMHQLQ